MIGAAGSAKTRTPSRKATGKLPLRTSIADIFFPRSTRGRHPKQHDSKPVRDIPNSKASATSMWKLSQHPVTSSFERDPSPMPTAPHNQTISGDQHERFANASNNQATTNQEFSTSQVKVRFSGLRRKLSPSNYGKPLTDCVLEIPSSILVRDLSTYVTEYLPTGESA